MPDERFEQTLTGEDARLLAELETNLARELSIEPSPEFLARVRLRVAELPEQRTGMLDWGWWQRRWMPALALAAVAVIVAAAVMMRSTPVDEPRREVVAMANPTPPAAIPPAAPVPGATGMLVPPAAPAAAPRVQRVARRAAGPDALRRATEPEVLVLEGQMDAIRQFLAGVRTGRVDASAVANTEAQASVGPAIVEQLAIPLLKIEPLPALTPIDGPRDR
jgi:hypothetical protein